MSSVLGGRKAEPTAGSVNRNGDSGLYLWRFYLNGSLKTQLALQDFDQGLAESRRGRRNLDSGGFHRRNLRLGIALAASNDRAGVAHAAARRGGATSDAADHRLF